MQSRIQEVLNKAALGESSYVSSKNPFDMPAAPKPPLNKKQQAKKEKDEYKRQHRKPPPKSTIMQCPETDPRYKG